MFGLISTETFNAQKAQNSRRRVFHEFPNGAAPLTGLLSLMEPDVTAQPEFSWFEKRYVNQRTTTAGISTGNGPFSTAGSDNPSTPGGFTLAQDDIIRVRTVANGTSVLRVTNNVRIFKVPNGATSIYDLVGVITAIVATNKFEMRVISAHPNTRNGDGTGGTTSAANLGILVIGTTNPEGARSTKGYWSTPRQIFNNTQIFRTAFTFTRTSLKSPLEYDKTGVYKEAAKENSLNHMIELERAFLWGEKGLYEAIAHDGEQVPERTMGGVMWFLQQWELGTVYGNSTSAITSIDDDQKRIIDVGGSMNIAQYNSYMSRLFTTTNNKDYAKLCLCGSGYLANLNQLFDGQIQVTRGEKPNTTYYGMNIATHETIDGTVYYKTHPLFNIDPVFKYSAMYIDIPNLKYRPLTDSDTILLKNRQENDEDRRKDEWITEAGLELKKPDSCMWIEGFNLAG